MEELFSGNLFMIYAVACIALISYSNFKENQRMFLLYFLSYATAFFKVLGVVISLGTLLIITFIFLEYLAEDSKKLELITKLSYKILDYLFMMFLQYSFVWVLMAFAVLLLIDNCELTGTVQIMLKGSSVMFLFMGTHKTISQPFRIKSITEICEVFEKYPPYVFEYEYKESMQPRFDLLCAFEDTTYFQRNKSYSCVSREYMSCISKRRALTAKKIFRCIQHACNARRGYSTPEMQLIRTIGILRGYDSHKVERKVFEVVYSKIIFASLKKYHAANTYLSFKYYRQYILPVYII